MTGASANGSGGEPLRLVVIGDSTSFTADRGPLLPSEPSLYPNAAAEAIRGALGREVSVAVLARAGYDARGAWELLTKDRHAQFEVLARADAVVVGVGSIDHAPAGLPPALEAVVPYVRPASARRRLRALMRGAYPLGVRLTRGSIARTPMAEFKRLYEGVLFQVRSLARGAAGVVLGPTSHVSPYYGGIHPGFAARERAQLAIARDNGFACVSSWSLVQDHVDRLNPDGIHWPLDVHAKVGSMVGETLAGQLLGAAPRPAPPQVGDPTPWS